MTPFLSPSHPITALSLIAEAAGECIAALIVTASNIATTFMLGAPHNCSSQLNQRDWVHNTPASPKLRTQPTPNPARLSSFPSCTWERNLSPKLSFAGLGKREPWLKQYNCWGKCSISFDFESTVETAGHFQKTDVNRFVEVETLTNVPSFSCC